MVSIVCPEIICFACIGLKIPIIVSERIDPHFHKIPRFYKTLRRCFYSHAKKVVVQTKSAAAYFKDLKNVVIIPNAVQKIKPIKRDFSLPITHVISVYLPILITILLLLVKQKVKKQTQQ